MVQSSLSISSLLLLLLIGGVYIRVSVSAALWLPAAALTFSARQSLGLAPGDALPTVIGGQFSAANGIAEAVLVGKVAGIPHIISAVGGFAASGHIMIPFRLSVLCFSFVCI
jgi:hypothetical protein